MTTKLAIYNQDLSAEVLAIYVDNDQANKFNTILQLRKIAQDQSIDGWINEYDLTWSSVQCANKHDL